MAKIAVVKMDPADTYSTGGVVEDVFIHMEGGVEENGYKFPWRAYESNNDYKVIEDATDNVKIGWILQDKTGVLRDPNSQYKYINKVIASSGASSIPH